jgi:hypothetical protein
MEIDPTQRSAIRATKNHYPHLPYPYPDIKDITVQYMFRQNAIKYKNRNHMGFRPYDPETKKWVCF